MCFRVFPGTVFYQQRASRWSRRLAEWRIHCRWVSDGEDGFNCVDAASVRCILVFISGRAALLAWFWYAKGYEDDISTPNIRSGIQEVRRWCLRNVSGALDFRASRTLAGSRSTKSIRGSKIGGCRLWVARPAPAT
jgi:hypothetical protein